MNERRAKIHRKTNETDIEIDIDIDGRGNYNINTGIGFLNHMLELFSKHSLVDVNLQVKGDLNVDDHHTTEDVAIVLGMALNKALGDKKGIFRYAFVLPMDDVLAEVAVDIGGRAYLVWNAKFKRERIGDLSTELLEHFFYSLTQHLGANVHVNVRYGKNEHHKAEAIFKAFAKAIRFSTTVDKRVADTIPSTKGSI